MTSAHDLDFYRGTTAYLRSIDKTLGRIAKALEMKNELKMLELGAYPDKTAVSLKKEMENEN